MIVTGKKARAKSEKAEKAACVNRNQSFHSSRIRELRSRKLTSSEVTKVLLHLWIPARARVSKTRVPKLRSRRALSEDEGNGNDADGEECAGQQVQEPHADVVLANDLPDKQDNGNLGNRCAHDVESLTDPVEFDRHAFLLSRQKL